MARKQSEQKYQETLKREQLCQMEMFEGNLGQDNASAQPAESEPVQRSSQPPSSQDIEAMRSWLLDWGQRHDFPAIYCFPHNPPDQQALMVRAGEECWEKYVRMRSKEALASVSIVISRKYE